MKHIVICLFVLGLCAPLARGQTADGGAMRADTNAMRADTDAVKAKGEKIDWSELDKEGGKPLPEAETPNLWAVMGNFVVAMALIVGIVVAGMMMIQKLSGRKVGFGAKDKPLRIVDRQVLGPKKAVVLLNACGRYLVLGVADKEISILTEVELPDGPSQTEAPPADFAESLSEAAPKDPGRP